MNNYTLCLKNGIKFAVNQHTGKALITLNGYIKLSGKPKQTISERATRAVLAGIGFEASLRTEENGCMRLRNHKLIPNALACEWLEKDNPELAATVNGDLFEFLGRDVDLSQYHKPKTVVEVVTEPENSPAAEIPTTEDAPTNALTVLDFNSKGIRFERRGDRVWASLSDMAKATDKLVADYTRQTSATQFLKELEGIMGIPIMVSNVGGKPETTGTWAIEEVAIDFAAWCSVGFRIWVAQQIRTLLAEGTVSIKQPKSTSAPTPPPQPPQLSAIERVQSLSELRLNLQYFGIEIENPRFKQLIQDFAGDILGLNQTALPEQSAPKYYGVAERAEQLGYPVALVVKHRSPLGCWVAKRVSGSRKESRLCNGTERPINLYRVTPELDAAIASYFDRL